MKHVGIAILNFNGSEYLKLTLDSLVRAKTNIPFTVGVIDNGSSQKDLQKAQKYFDNYIGTEDKQDGFFIASDKNLGFSGGNNVVISRFLKDEKITHVCLLNSDVIVTDYWLDYLLRSQCSVVGPVTNAAGNEQTIKVDYKVELALSAFEKVNKYACMRHEAYDGYYTKSDILYFFNTVIERKVIENVGLLDEQFYPGSFEDNDYCLRILKAGYDMTIIRDCFVHHFGSGSFAKLDMPKRLDISNINRQRFEAKWGIKWKDVSWKLLESCRQDINCFTERAIDPWSNGLLNASLRDTEQMIENWAEAISFYQSDQYVEHLLRDRIPVNLESNQESDPIPRQMISMESLSGKQLLKLVYVKARIKLRKKFHLDKKLESKKKNNTISSQTDLEIIENIIKSRQNAGKKNISIFAPMPSKKNEKDGYIQRILAIDESILDDYLRVYMYDDGMQCDEIKTLFIDEGHIYVLFNSHDKEQRNQIFDLVQKCGIVYTHSLLRFMTDSIHSEMCQIFTIDGITKIWDVHGAVPEEYLLSGSKLGHEIANEVEKFLYTHVDVIIAVNFAMKDHLHNKYGLTNANFVVLPIFNQNILQSVIPSSDKIISGDKATVVYSGGLQEWQNISMMQDIIEKTMEDFNYKIFVPQPKAFLKMWGNRSKMINAIVDSKSPDQMGEEYRKCHYGMVLRDNIAVNNVACPTKIIEYIQYGIVPIYKTEAIGDFVKLGMKYISYEVFMNGQMPNEEERIRMAEHNYKVLKELVQIYEVGCAEFKNLLS